MKREPTGSRREGLALYGFTLLLELVFGATARWLLVWIGLAVFPLPLPDWVRLAPWLVALAPIVWSLAALARIGDRGAGNLPHDVAHEPDDAERAELWGAIAELWIVNEGKGPPIPDHIRIVRESLPTGMVRRDTIFLTSALLRSRYLAAVLAHELSHLESKDSWLGVALDRLGRDRGILGYRLENLPGLWKVGGVVGAPGRLLLRLAGGGAGHTLLYGRWSRYRNAKEFRADAYAASLGQGPQLAAHLRSFLPLSARWEIRLLGALTCHPPTPERIERLERAPRPAAAVEVERFLARVGAR
jgi:Zn-dependent protease with chaperone function